MRKTIVTALVVLLVMLASCDSVLGVPGSDKAGYTANGQELVNLSISIGENAGSSRTLSAANNVAGEKDFVEVIFTDGTTFYRATGWYGTTLSIKLPKITYPVANAIAFIGKKNGAADYTLLAVGKLGGPLDTTIATSATFTSTPLTAALNADATSPSPAFAITESTISGVTGWSDTGISKKGLISGIEPCFQVPRNHAGIKATLTIGGLSTSPDLGLKGTGIPSATFTGSTPLPTVTTFDADDISFGTTCVYNFTFTTVPVTADASFIITFKIPVAFVLSSTVKDAAGLDWIIRGGTTLNAGDSVGNRNEGVLLAVSTSPSTESVTITIPSTGL